MRTAGIKPGDVIDCEVRGQSFMARVTELPHNTIMAKPLVGGMGERRVSPRQVKGIYSKRAGSR